MSLHCAGYAAPEKMLCPNCLLCGKALTDPVSMARFIGPECAGTSSANLRSMVNLGETGQPVERALAIRNVPNRTAALGKANGNGAHDGESVPNETSTPAPSPISAEQYDDIDAWSEIDKAFLNAEKQLGEDEAWEAIALVIANRIAPYGEDILEDFFERVRIIAEEDDDEDEQDAA
jgi:Family of unknown function (DUF6011)